MSLLLSMSEYDNKPRAYGDAYDYPATRPEQNYPSFAAHHNFASPYVGTQAQVPSGLPQASQLPSAQPYGTHDPTYYGQQNAQYSTYLEAAPRQVPEITSYTPMQGQPGTQVTVYFRSLYDFDNPSVTVNIMFGEKRCVGTLHKSRRDQTYEYALTSDAPPPALAAGSISPVPLHLLLDNTSTVSWESPSFEFGSFTYLESPAYQSTQSPEVATSRNKRKLSVGASPCNSPQKKPSYQQQPRTRVDSTSYLSTTVPTLTPDSPFRRPSLPDAYFQNRRYSGADYHHSYNNPLPGAQASQYYGVTTGQSTKSLHPSQSPSSWTYHQGNHPASRSPAAAMSSTVGKTTHLLPSPASTAPPLIRTSRIANSPTIPASAAPSADFNPYTMYPANSKAMLKIEGDLQSMVENWSRAEWESKRRLVQFRRSQSGSVINATFEAVTLEDRIPNSICVSCIWWEDKAECYVTSVDTISLLESLVAVRFTVEEKNRIRRNLEGFRPATVSKVKPESEEFFKLIMGFPNPKPRNIEKDVKVFPWRILATALKKIIGKYSASYSSTAGALHTPAAASYPLPRDEQPRGGVAASPRSTSSSATTSHGHAYAPHTMSTNAYSPHAVSASAGPGIGPSAGPPDLRLSVPASAAGQTTSWHQPASQYTSDVAARTSSWDYGHYLNASPATGLPGSVPTYQYHQHHQRYPSLLTGNQTMPSETRFVPLHDYEDQGHHQQTTTG